MRTQRRSFLPLGLAFLAVAAIPSIASAKCVESLGRPLRPGYVLFIDGRLIGEYPMSGGNAQLPAPEEVVSVEHLCIDAPQPDAPRGMRQAAVRVVTRRGFPEVARRQLAALVAAQESHRAQHGVYAPDLATLRLAAPELGASIEMTVSARGFTATTGWEEAGSRCQVAVGSGDTVLGREPRGAARSAGSGRPLVRRLAEGVPFCTAW